MIIGIDLGTTYSLVSRLDEQSHLPVLMPDQTYSDTLYTPSVVYLDDEREFAYVGQAVETLIEQRPAVESQVLRFFKQQLGTGRAMRRHKGTAWHSEAVAGLVLKKLGLDAHIHAAQEVEAAVVTVPAHFNDLQRKAVKAAAYMADIPLIGLVEEPVAAALAYGVTNRAFGDTLLVYDLGGGTFDATVLTITPDSVDVLAKDGVTELGGRNFDDEIIALLFEQFEAAGLPPVRRGGALLQQARRAAEDIKIALCEPGRQSVRQTVVLGSNAAEVTVRRRAFERRIQRYLDQADEVLLRCVRGADLNPEDVDTVLLVGGSSMTPLVKTRVELLFDREHQRILFNEPTKAVAMGAALHAHQLTGQAAERDIPPAFRGVAGYDLGIRARDAKSGRIYIDKLIRRNSPLPSRATRTYYTGVPNQRRFRLEVVQIDGAGEDVPLGNLIVGPLPEGEANRPIEVELVYSEDGTVSVHTQDPTTGQQIRRTFGEDSTEGFRHLAIQHQLVRSTVLQSV